MRSPLLHEAMFYSSDEEYVAGIRRFTADGRDTGDSVLVAVPEQKLALLRSTASRVGIDVQYADMINDPLATMKRLYAQLGDDWTPEAEAGIQAWLDDNPQDKFGKHEYKLAQYGLTLDKLQPMFERYLARYDVAKEG